MWKTPASFYAGLLKSRSDMREIEGNEGKKFVGRANNEKVAVSLPPSEKFSSLGYHS
jgi:hypothetical protein